MRNATRNGQAGSEIAWAGLTLIVLILLGAQPSAAQMLGTDWEGQMFVVNTTTGAGHFICNTPNFGNLGSEEIEFNNITQRGIVQGVDGSFIHREFNPVGCVALGGPVVNNWSFDGLEWVGDVLYGAGIQSPCAEASLLTVSPVSGAVALIGPTGIGRPISGLAWDCVNLVMYGVTECSADTSSLLARVNISTGQATVIGDTGKSLGALEFGKDGILYAGGNRRDGGNFYRINEATATATLIGPTGFGSVTGLALAEPPVPTVATTWTAIKLLYYR